VTVAVTVTGVDDSVFHERDYLFLAPPSKTFCSQGGQRSPPACEVAQGRGPGLEQIVLDPAHAGRVYSKGIFVEEKRDLVHGVGLNLALNRDRFSIASHHALRKSIGYLWADAVTHPTEGAHLLPRFVEVLQQYPHSVEAEIPGRFWLPMIEQFPFAVVEELHQAVRAIQRHFREVHPGAFPCTPRELDQAQCSLRCSAVPCSRPYLDLLQCSTASDDLGSALSTTVAFSTLSAACRVNFVDPDQRSTKDSPEGPYAGLVQEVRRRAKAALGIDPENIVFKPATIADIDALRVGSTYMVNDRYLEPQLVHSQHGGCIPSKFGGECQCCTNFIVACLIAREYGTDGPYRVYCERDTAHALRNSRSSLCPQKRAIGA